MGQRCCCCCDASAREVGESFSSSQRGSSLQTVEHVSSLPRMQPFSVHDLMHQDVKTPSNYEDFEELRATSKELLSFYSCEELPHSHFSLRSPNSQTSSFAPSASIGSCPPSIRTGSFGCSLEGIDEGIMTQLAGTWEGIPGTIEGFGEFLDVSGCGWAKKRLAMSLVNTFTPRQEISNLGNCFLIVVKTPGGVDTKEFVVNGPPFEGTFGPEKALGTGVATWEGHVLVLRVTMPGKTTESRRWLSDEKLIQTDKLTMAANGRSAVLKRTFKRSD